MNTTTSKKQQKKGNSSFLRQTAFLQEAGIEGIGGSPSCGSQAFRNQRSPQNSQALSLKTSGEALSDWEDAS